MLEKLNEKTENNKEEKSTYLNSQIEYIVNAKERYGLQTIDNNNDNDICVDNYVTVTFKNHRELPEELAGTIIDTQEINCGEIVPIPESPTLDGYNFIEWNTKNDGSGISYHSGDQITIDSDTILYAIWVKDYDYNEVLYTGGKTRIYRNSRLHNGYTNIVRDDANGDGKIGVVDYLKIRKIIMEGK